MSLIIPANTLASGGYEVDNSLRFNRGSSDYLNRTPSSAGNRKTMTYSFWLKRSAIASTDYHWFSTGGAGAVPRSIMAFESSEIYIAFNSSGSSWNEIFTNALFRDVSAWYHVVVAIDTTQSTASNRTRIYVNGSEITSFRSASYVSQNTDLPNNNSSIPHFIGRNTLTGTAYFDGYIAEAVCIDGSQLDPTSFGEFDEDSGIWKPIDVSGLTFGNNGFYLETKQSGTSQNSSGLGADTSGNDNHFAVNNLTAIDQSTDTCTNNFCTWNSLDNFYSSATFSEGNTTVVTPNASLTYATGTVGLSSGRWYFEVQPFDPSDNNNIGIVDHVSTSNSSSAGELQFQPRGWCYRQVGDVYNNNSSVSGSWDSYSAGVTIGVFVDLEDNKIYWSRNGVMQNSGTGVAITAAASTDTGFYFPAVGDYVTNDDTTFRTNFGGVSSFAISSGVTDDNGYGTFEYTPSVTVDSTAKKFYAICTKNLAEYG